MTDEVQTTSKARKARMARKISMRVTPEMEREVDELAAALDLDKSSIIRYAVARLHLEMFPRK